jgi:hypothetical protein
VCTLAALSRASAASVPVILAVAGNGASTPDDAASARCQSLIIDMGELLGDARIVPDCKSDSAELCQGHAHQFACLIAPSTRTGTAGYVVKIRLTGKGIWRLSVSH